MAAALTILESVELGNYVYRDEGAKLPEGFTSLTPGGPNDLDYPDGKLDIDGSGFYAEAIRHDASGEIIIAVRGSDEGGDWWNENVHIFDGGEQTDQIRLFTDAVIETYPFEPGDNLHFVGDSLGDRLGLEGAVHAAKIHTEMTFSGVGTNGTGLVLGDDEGTGGNLTYVNLDNRGDLVHRIFDETGALVELPIGDLGDAALDGLIAGAPRGLQTAIALAIYETGSEAIAVHTNRQATIDFLKEYPQLGNLTTHQVANLTPSQIEQIATDIDSFDPYSPENIVAALNEVTEISADIDNRLQKIEDEFEIAEGQLNNSALPPSEAIIYEEEAQKKIQDLEEQQTQLEQQQSALGRQFEYLRGEFNGTQTEADQAPDSNTATDEVVEHEVAEGDTLVTADKLTSLPPASCCDLEWKQAA